MAEPGPFGNDEDKTVLLPNPGGRVTAQAAAVAAAPVSAPVADLTALKFDAAGNALLTYAAPLLSLAMRLRTMVAYTGIEQLKQNLVKDIADFERKVSAAGFLPEQIKSASYVLSAFIDESIQNTPWGTQSNWGHMCLLITVHGEAWGGERFFQVLDYALKHPAQNLALIELCYVLLSFGFEGKYRVINQGANELEKLRVELYQVIQRTRGDFPVELSAHWQGRQTGNQSLAAQVPLWVTGAVAAAVLLLAYLAFAFALNVKVDPVYKQLLALANEPITIPAAVAPPQPLPPPVAAAQRFKPLLSAEIGQGMVEVVDDKILRIRNSFASGSDRVKPEFIPMLKKIALELANGRDTVLITGHTDNQPIISARFPSNWQLSQARADNVLALLKASANLHEPVRAEGRADGEPLVANDSAEHRAFNRRVDVLVN